MSKDLYFVQKEGVCPHGIALITLDRDHAVVEASRIAKQDTDDYHDWVVLGVDFVHTYWNRG